MGGNGEPITRGHIPIVTPDGILISVPPGTGGGCIASGPFANATVNLGPVGLIPKGPDGGLGYNPRCVTRDINLNFSNLTKPVHFVKQVGSGDSLETFDGNLEDPQTGLHPIGHFVMGGLEMDAWASLGDPAFYLHHAAVDWVWTLWQGLDPGRRTKQIFGTGTYRNSEPQLYLLPC